MRVVDLFCGAGGASMGILLACPDAHITGVDIRPQAHYPFDFVLADALAFNIEAFDYVWASPPCQAHSALRSCAWDASAYARKHHDLIPATRAKLLASGKPYCIENVPKAPLANPITLCASAFGLKTKAGAQLRRHRIFECSFDPGPSSRCAHSGTTIGIFGKKARNTALEKRHYSIPRHERPNPSGILFSLADAREAMGIDWMGFSELSEAIPPKYSEHITKQYLKSVACS
jgi:DNA (cytosine-5)-methyltransferase 1